MQFSNVDDDDISVWETRENENENYDGGGYDENWKKMRSNVQNDTKELNFKVRTARIFKKLLPPRPNCLTHSLNNMFHSCLLPSPFPQTDSGNKQRRWRRSREKRRKVSCNNICSSQKFLLEWTCSWLTQRCCHHWRVVNLRTGDALHTRVRERKWENDARTACSCVSNVCWECWMLKKLDRTPH